MNEQIKKAKAYSRIRHGMFIAETAATLSFLLIISANGLSGKIGLAVRSIFANTCLSDALYLAIIGLSLNIVVFPYVFMASFMVEHRFSLSRQGIGSWLSDYFKSQLMSGAISIAAILSIYYFIRAYAYWWFFAGLLYLFLSLVLAKILPVLIIPLFYKLTPVPDGPLKTALTALAKKSGVNALAIYSINLGSKTKKANAALCGLGSTKRILLSDTLIENYTHDEIEATLAHELAHYKHKHFWKLNFTGFTATLLSFFILDRVLHAVFGNNYIYKISAISYFPIAYAIFLVLAFLSMPLVNFISRAYERQADLEAVSMTKKPDVFAQLIEKLTSQNLSDPSPGALTKAFFYDHPPADERIRSLGGVVSKI